MAGKPLNRAESMDYLNIRVTRETKQKLVDLAQRDRRTVSDYVRLILEDFLSKREGG